MPVVVERGLAVVVASEHEAPLARVPGREGPVPEEARQCALAPALVCQGDEATVRRPRASLFRDPERAQQVLPVVEPRGGCYHRSALELHWSTLVLVLRRPDRDELAQAGAPVEPGAAAVGPPVRHRPTHRLERVRLHEAPVEANEAVDRAHRRSTSALNSGLVFHLPTILVTAHTQEVRGAPSQK